MPKFHLLFPKILIHFKITAGFFFGRKLGAAALGCIAMVATAAPAAAETHRLNNDEMSLFQKISSNPDQERKTVKLDPILCMVARERAADMARRHYFGHTNPDGKGANFLVRRAGYVLPSSYSSSPAANSIESIGMGFGPSKEIVKAWLKSGVHRIHILGETDFYKEQTSVGVGVFRSYEAPHYKYYVFLSAPPNASLNPRLVILKDPKGKIIVTTRPLSGAGIPFLGMAGE